MNIDINDLKIDRSNIVDQMNDILDIAQKEGRDLTTSEEGHFNKLESEQKKIRNRINKLERVTDYQKELNELSSEPFKMGLGNSVNNSTKVNPDLDIFVRTGGVQNALSVGTGGTDAVIPLRDSTLATLIREGNPFRQLIKVQQVQNNGSFEELISSGSAQSSYVGESTARPELSNPDLNLITTTLMEIYSLQTLTQRLVSQSYLDLSEWISQEMAISISELEAEKMISGAGSATEPKGLNNQTYTTEADDARAFGTIQKILSGNATLLDEPDTLKEVLYSLKSGYRASSTWVMNSATALIISKMKDSDGNYIWSDSLQVAEPSVLLGRPVQIVESADDIGAGNFPIFLADWNQAIRMIENDTVSITADPFTNRPHLDFYSFYYSGHALRNSEAIKAVSVEA